MTTIKVVYNTCYGGFGLSNSGLDLYNEKRKNFGFDPINMIGYLIRSDPLLVEVVEELGDKAGNESSKLKIKNIPVEYSTCYDIHEYDGLEIVICDPKDLVAEKLRKLDLNSLSDNECRNVLNNLLTILETHDK